MAACPSLEELASGLSDLEATGLSDHLASCLRCRARAESLARSGAAAVGPIALPAPLDRPIRNMPKRVRPDTPLVFGSICSVASDARPGERLVVVVIGGAALKDPETQGSVTVAPISIERHFASGWDALVEMNESGLDYEFMIELWNYGRIAHAQLDESFGGLHPAACKRLEVLWRAVREGAGAAPTEACVGPAILDDEDPRIGFQREEIDRAAAFYTPGIESVAELSGSFVRLLRERDLVSPISVEEGSREAKVLAHIRGSGFILPPDSKALGRVINLLAVSVEKGTDGGARLEEEASAWIENEQPELQLAARKPLAGLRRIGRKLRRHSDDVEDYVATVRAAAGNGDERAE